MLGILEKQETKTLSSWCVASLGKGLVQVSIVRWIKQVQNQKCIF